MRLILKRLVQYAVVAVVWPSAAACLFGRSRRRFAFFSQSYALIPGFPGDRVRAAFYHLTLEQCSLDTVISFGTIFSRRDARLESFVSIGSYCTIGTAYIGARTQIASRVGIPSGRHQHSRGADGKFQEAMGNEVVAIGTDCWIGENSVIMASIGAGSTVGAGSVVVKEIPPGSVAVGNPARVIRQAGEGA